MSPNLRNISGKQAVRALERLGFVQKRQRGSHVLMVHEAAGSNRGCVVPLHTELAIGTLRSILRQADVSVDEFLKAL